jgi:site-specific recombinase XerD
MGKSFYFLRPSKSNLHSLYVGLRHPDGQFLLRTGIKINPAHWNEKKNEVKNVALAELDIEPEILARKAKEDDIKSFTNNTLHEITNFINERSHLDREIIKSEFTSFLFDKSDLQQFALDLQQYVNGYVFANKQATKQDLIKAVDTYLHPPKNDGGLFAYITTFIANSEKGERSFKGKSVVYRTIQRYRSTETLLLEFQKQQNEPFTFNMIDKAFIDAFNAFMKRVKNYSPTTMGKHVSTLKSFLNEATDEGLNKNLKFKSKAFAVTKTAKDAIALSESDITAMYNLDLSHRTGLDRVRDLFIIATKTGLRFSDFTEIKPENIKRNDKGIFIDKIQFKTKDKVVIPIDETVLEILNKYDNNLPKAISNQKFNDYIKEIAQLVPQLHEIHERSITKGGITSTVANPKWELISSHTARRSFATNAYKRGTPTLSIMAITGHKTEAAFLAYIKVTKEEHAEMIRQHFN